MPRMLTELFFKHSFSKSQTGGRAARTSTQRPKASSKSCECTFMLPHAACCQAISRNVYVQATASLALNNEHASPADPWTSSSPQKWPCLSPVAKHMRTQSGQRFTFLLRPGCPPPGREFPYSSMSQAASDAKKGRWYTTSSQTLSSSTLVGRVPGSILDF